MAIITNVDLISGRYMEYVVEIRDYRIITFAIKNQKNVFRSKWAVALKQDIAAYQIAKGLHFILDIHEI